MGKVHCIPYEISSPQLLSISLVHWKEGPSSSKMVGIRSQPIGRSDDGYRDHRRAEAELVQGPLLDDPAFLKEIVQRVVQELLEAEMTELLEEITESSGLDRIE
jgi:hypothetical protein